MAGEYMQNFLGFLQESPAVKAYGLEQGAATDDGDVGEIATQFQDFVWDVDKVGLRNWLRMDIHDLERFLPRGPLGDLEVTEDNIKVAKLMLRCAARNRANLLDFECVEPSELLHSFPVLDIEDELATLPQNEHVTDFALADLVDSLTGTVGRSSTDEGWLSQGTSIDSVFESEMNFYRTTGPVEWQEDGGKDSWKWRQPPNTIWDDQRRTYIPEQVGVDPNLDLKEMRQHMLKITRMGSMCKSGRIHYFRAIVVVGNGKGIYGFGVGFGNTPLEARADGSLRALQNLDYIDTDPGRMMTTPCKGMEYKHSCLIVPRPIGRGLKANKKFFTTVIHFGLDNCKVSFMGGSRWFTKIKAIKRALDMMMSRRTLANMTGKRYALLVAPGDHWVHWPDRWFENIRAPYDSKAFHAKLARKHALRFKHRSNIVASQREVRPGWREENWARWNHPLERSLQLGLKASRDVHPVRMD